MREGDKKRLSLNHSLILFQTTIRFFFSIRRERVMGLSLIQRIHKAMIHIAMFGFIGAYGNYNIG